MAPRVVDVICGVLPVQERREDVAVGDHLEGEPATGGDRPRRAVGPQHIVMVGVARIQGPGPELLAARRRVDQGLVPRWPVAVAGRGVGAERRAEEYTPVPGGVEASLDDQMKVLVIAALGIEVAGRGV